MDIFRIALTTIILAALLSFRHRPELSRFEINRLAERKKKYKTLAKFLDIYPGILSLARILSLITAILLTTFATRSWGIFGGGGLAFAAILLAWLLGRMFHKVTQNLTENHLDFFNKYFAWAGVLSNLTIVGDELRIGSEQELVHLIESGDFLDDAGKLLMKNSLAFRNANVADFMTKRDDIKFVHSKDTLTPIFIDELFNSGHRFFPVVQGGLDRVVGFLMLDDIMPIGQEEKILTHEMRKPAPAIDSSASLEFTLRHMCQYHTTTLIVEKNDKTVGLLTLSDIKNALLNAR